MLNYAKPLEVSRRDTKQLKVWSNTIIFQKEIQKENFHKKTKWTGSGWLAQGNPARKHLWLWFKSLNYSSCNRKERNLEILGSNTDEFVEGEGGGDETDLVWDGSINWCN